MKQLKILLMAALAMLMLLAAGCGSDSGKAADSSASSAVKTESNASAGTPDAKKDTKLTLKVYYPDDQGLKLIAVKRTVDTKGSDKYTAAMKSLLTGTTEKGQTNVIPKQARLKSVTVKGDTAYVDFSAELVKKFTGGSTGEEMLVGSVVNTLTEFSEVKKVQILVDGQAIESLAGHLDLSAPQTRMENLLK